MPGQREGLVSRRRRSPAASAAPAALHPRVVHAKSGQPFTYYVGRGACPACRPGWCDHKTLIPMGNPFRVEDHGDAAMSMFFDWLDGKRGGFLSRGQDVAMHARKTCGGSVVVACWCVGRYPCCHGEVYVRLGDGEDLAAIRADMLARLAPPAPEPSLFGGA